MSLSTLEHAFGDLPLSLGVLAAEGTYSMGSFFKGLQKSKEKCDKNARVSPVLTLPWSHRHGSLCAHTWGTPSVSCKDPAEAGTINNLRAAYPF